MPDVAPSETPVHETIGNKQLFLGVATLGKEWMSAALFLWLGVGIYVAATSSTGIRIVNCIMHTNQKTSKHFFPCLKEGPATGHPVLYLSARWILVSGPDGMVVCMPLPSMLIKEP